MRAFAYFAVCMLALSPAARAQAEPSYFVAHIGPETCVPLADIGDDLSRVYYGAGDLRTPRDFEHAIREMGLMISEDPTSTNATYITYDVSAPILHKRTKMVLFTDKTACDIIMARQTR